MSALNGVTIVTKLKSESLAKAREILAELNAGLAKEETLFHQSNTTHFSRWVVLDPLEHPQAGSFEPCLIFASNFDGPLDEYLISLLDIDFEFFKRLYSCCIGFNEPKTSRALFLYLMRHQNKINCYFKAHIGRTAEIIKKEERLYQSIDQLITENVKDWESKSASEIRTVIQRKLRKDPELSWALTEPVWEKTPFLTRYSVYIAGIALIGLAFAVELIWLVVLTAILLTWLIRQSERSEIQDSQIVDSQQFARLVDLEDRIVQNQMTSITFIKPTKFRHFVLKTVLKGVDLLAKTQFRDGRLGLITTIHFARWFTIDNDRRLVFFSNYDGSWENYLGDFIDRASLGLTAIWSNTIGFPDTRFLVLGGSRDEVRFKNFARNSQVQTDFWYSAYKGLSSENILNNSEIRRGLIGDLSESKSKEWLRRF